MDRPIRDGDKLQLLHKAADIAISAASGSKDPSLLADIIESTYTKMLSLAAKADKA